MLTERQRMEAYWTWLADLSSTSLAYVLAWLIRSELATKVGMFPTGLYPLSRYLTLLPLVLAVWTAILLARESYTARKRLGPGRELLDLIGVAALGSLILAAVGWLLRLHFVSRPFLVIFTAADVALMWAGRLITRRLLTRGREERRVLIVGTGPVAKRVADRLKEYSSWGVRLVGFVDTGHSPTHSKLPAPILGNFAQLEQILRTEVVDDVVFALKHTELADVENAFLVCSELGVNAKMVVLLPHVGPRMLLDELDGLHMLTFSPSPASPFGLFSKRVFDIMVASSLLVLSAPLMALIAVLIKLDSEGPVLFKQTRCGLNGRRFTLLKFRTMYKDAEAKQGEIAHLNVLKGPVFKAAKDPRVTRVGKWLRRFSLDELPQLINVLRGEMSMVGPRPPLPSEVERYERWQRRRLAMKPGITGLWQVSGRAKIKDFSDWARLDLEYIDNWSLLLDFWILLRTIPAVILGKGAA